MTIRVGEPEARPRRRESGFRAWSASWRDIPLDAWTNLDGTYFRRSLKFSFVVYSRQLASCIVFVVIVKCIHTEVDTCTRAVVTISTQRMIIIKQWRRYKAHEICIHRALATARLSIQRNCFLYLSLVIVYMLSFLFCFFFFFSSSSFSQIPTYLKLLVTWLDLWSQHASVVDCRDTLTVLVWRKTVALVSFFHRGFLSKEKAGCPEGKGSRHRDFSQECAESRNHSACEALFTHTRLLRAWRELFIIFLWNA